MVSFNVFCPAFASISLVCISVVGFCEYKYEQLTLLLLNNLFRQVTGWGVWSMLFSLISLSSSKDVCVSCLLHS